jgi:hypothetical protein
MKKPFLPVTSLLVAMLACATAVPILPEEAKDHVGENARERRGREHFLRSLPGNAVHRDRPNRVIQGKPEIVISAPEQIQR